MTVIDNKLNPPLAQPAPALPRATRLAVEMLQGLEGGALGLDLPQGQRLRVGQGPMLAHMQVRDHAVFSQVLARGDIGFAESYMDGDWDCDDLVAVLSLLAANRRQLKAAIYGRVLRLVGQRLWHMLRANTRAGSRRNIEAHYDLGNDFYQLWLDPSMTYSAALFSHADDSLEEAQQRKYRRILQQLAVQPGQTILEIGCGWGGFAEMACREYGAQVLGITLSPSQLAFAQARAERGGFSRQADFALCDYRDVRGQYDHIVSIEMIEAVGERFWPHYFDQLAALLKPGGRCVVQSITIADELFASYRRGVDFIQRHIFPGGMLPCPRVISEQATRVGLAIEDDLAFGADYGRTLAHWHRSFNERAADVRAQGFPERFLRMWRFYLAYCEAGFKVGDIDVHHYCFAHAKVA